jgi:protein-tyrosine phosphatase
MRRMVAEAGLEGQIEIDSAGTGSWHVGHPPDARSTEAARRRGTVLEGAARRVRPEDFAHYDLLLAMDDENLRDLRRIAPPGAEHKIRKLATRDVPDPYYGGPGGFDEVLDIVEEACQSLLDELRQA